MCLTAVAVAQVTIHVPGDQPTIQAGIDAASNGDVVLVDDGTYFENINFKGKAITVASLYWDDGDPAHIDNTIIDGSKPLHPDSASVVSFFNGEDTTSILMGFTIQGGGGTLVEDELFGGGIFCRFAGPKIVHNKIINNLNINEANIISGGGISATRTTPLTIIIRDNLISNNICFQDEGFLASGGGISVAYYSSCILENNIITQNQAINMGAGQALGGGIEFYLSTVVVQYNTFLENIAENYNSSWNPWGGGIYGEDINEGSVITGNLVGSNTANGGASSKGGGIGIFGMTGPITIDGNLVEDNEARFGAGLSMAVNQSNTISNNLFMENTASDRGGAMSFQVHTKSVGSTDQIRGPENFTGIESLDLGSNTIVIVNNTVYENTATFWAGAILYDYQGPLAAFNNIFYGNASLQQQNEILLAGNSSGYLNTNLLDTNQVAGGGMIIMKGNFSDNPLFADDSCHLSWNSPCGDAGLDSLVINSIPYYPPDHDYEFDPRPMYSQYDIGADEAPYDFPQSIIIPAIDKNLRISIYPNPVSSTSEFRYQISDIRNVKLSVYDAFGRLIETLVDEVQQPGEYTYIWNAEDLPLGIYIYRLTAGDEVASGKIVVR
jgi:hypothetical protein